MPIGPTGSKPKVLTPFWESADRTTAKLYLGHVVDVLSKLPEKHFHTTITSPPYWGLRDYGVEGQLGAEPSPDCRTWGQAQCGACFVCNMVAVFRGVRRVLRDDGTCWLNLGDSYCSSPAGNTKPRSEQGDGEGMFRLGGDKQAETLKLGTRKMDTSKCLPSGNLVGVPWRVALALQADGWVLRQDVIWAKPSPMPESVKNRCTKAHEYVFLLTKRMGYYCDMEAIKEKSAGGALFRAPTGAYEGRGDFGSTGNPTPVERSNKRSVWSVSSPMLRLRSDLTDEQKTYVLGELVRRGLI